MDSYTRHTLLICSIELAEWTTQDSVFLLSPVICGLLSQELPPRLTDRVQAGEKKTFFLEENILLFLTWGL